MRLAIITFVLSVVWSCAAAAVMAVPVRTTTPTITAAPAATMTPAPTATAAPTATPWRCIVTADALNVRSGAGVNYPAIGWLYKGDVCEITANNDGWLQISAGWINGDYCEVQP